MTVEHRLISHQPDSACGVSVFRPDGRRQLTVVISELPDNPGVPVENALRAAVGKVSRAFLHGVPLDQVDWVYRKEGAGRETLVHLRLNRGGGITNSRFLEHLGELIGEKPGKLNIPHLAAADILDLKTKVLRNHVFT